jgi:hypothetical protein
MGAIRFPVEQIPISDVRFQRPHRSTGAGASSRDVSLSHNDAVDSLAPSVGGLALNEWGTYSLASLRLSASRLEAQTSDGGARTTLQASQIELAAQTMTLRSDDGLIEFSLSSLTMRASQLSLSFAQEQRQQRVSQFMRRMDDLAARLEAPSASRLRVSAQALSLRFSASASISETALNGFEKGATMLSGPGNSIFAHFLVLFRTFLTSSDEEASEFLERLNEFLEAMASLAEGNTDAADANAAIQQAVPPGSADGVRVFFEQIEMSYTRVEMSMGSEQRHEADPLVLDLDGNGISVVEAEAAQPFDMFGSGTPVAVTFPAAGDAFLAVDSNMNGRIDSGKELFGDQHGAPNGFAELAKYDQNLDGIVDRHDAIYEQLLLFGDLDADGTVRPDEFTSLSNAGITAIDLRHNDVSRALTDGNRIAQSSRFVRNDGSTGEAADLVLRTFSALA